MLLYIGLDWNLPSTEYYMMLQDPTECGQRKTALSIVMASAHLRATALPSWPFSGPGAPEVPAGVPLV